MSFLTLDQSIAPFSECLISFWFREPNEAVTIAAAAPKIGDPLYPEFDKKIPLVVFGGPRVQQEYVATFPVIATSPNYLEDAHGLLEIIDGTWEITTESIGLKGSHYLDPTYIGLDVNGGGLDLVINLQLDQFPVIKNWFFAPDGVTDTFIPAIVPYPRGLDQNIYAPSGMTDVSVIQLMRGVPENYSISVPLTPTVDQWHHVLMSFDLGASVQTTALDGIFATRTFKNTVQDYSKMWLVVDGVSIKMPDVTESTITGQPDDALLSFNQQSIATTPYDSTNPASVGFGGDGIGIPNDPITGFPLGFASVFAGSFTAFKPAPSYKLANPVISAGAVGIPAMTRFLKSVYRVEMAEYQMWSGSSKDVRKPATLGLFLTDKGKPNLNAKDVTNALGKPKIKLHGSGNWRIGKNTGVFDSDFTPTGGIKKWKPNPSLHGSQNPIQDETN